MTDLINSGIYIILNTISLKLYVGSAKHFKNRWKTHKHELRFNKHPNQHLQNSWNTHGEENFEFIIVELVKDFSKLAEREEYWFSITNCHDGYHGFNKLKHSRTSLGYKHTEETLAKMAKAQTGRIHSELSRQNRSIALKGKPKSEIHKIRNGLAKRTPDKWPHEKGRRCKCRECKDKTNAYVRKRRAIKNNNGFTSTWI